MLVRVPDYFGQFHCLAGACPHSCCEKWEVVIDEESADRYSKECGALGEKLRAAMCRDAEGDACFPLNGGRCPFLDAENLCEIHRQLGEEATSVTCREHPRFTEDYGAFREITLSASCPAANALLLGSGEPLRFIERVTDEPEEEGDEWLKYLLPLREKLLELLQDRNRSLKLRMADFLELAAAAQALLDEERVEELPALAAAWSGGAANWRPELPEGMLEFLDSLEILEKDWSELLSGVKSADLPEPNGKNDDALERIAVYFAFRYLLKAVNDGDLLSRAQLCVAAALTIERLGGSCGLAEALRRFSCEVEHSEENLEELLGAFWQGTLCVLPFENDLRL